MAILRGSNAVAAIVLFFVVALSPLPLGSTSPVVIASWCGMLGIAVATLSLRGTQAAHLWLLAGLGFVVIAYAAVIHEQLSAHPWIAGFSPWWSRASAALAEPIDGSPSVVRNQAWYMLGSPLLICLVLCSSLVICTDRVWARRLTNWVLCVGTSYAVFGIGSFLADPTHIISFEKYAYRDVLTGTFINRNTAAVYFGSCVILGTLRAAMHIVCRPDKYSHLQPSLGVLRTVGFPRKSIAPAAMASICLVAMLMTASRAGIILSLMCTAIGVLLAVRPRLAGRRTGLFALVAGIAFIGVLLIVLGGAVANRFALQGLSDGGRTEIYAATLDVIKDNWLVGTGLGTFRWGFSPYRPSDIPVWGVWDRAHNTILEIATEMGVPLASIVLLGALLILAVLARGALIRRSDRAICIAGLAVALLSFSHALVDFSLQIPGYAITAFAVIGAGLAQSFRPLNSPASP